MNSELKEKDIPRLSSAFKPISRNPDISGEMKSHCVSTMTDSQKTVYGTSQTVRKEQIDSSSATDSISDSTPCLKHAAQNINRKASDIPTEKISLCSKCSKSMLSYIFLVQDFLDSLAKEIVGDGASNCLQCARQESRNNIAILDTKDELSDRKAISETQSDEKSGQSKTESRSKDISNEKPIRRTSRTKSYHDETKRSEDYRNSIINQQRQQMDFLYNVPSPSKAVQDVNAQNIPTLSSDRQIIIEQPSSENQISDQAKSSYRIPDQQETTTCHQTLSQQSTVVYHQAPSQQQASTSVQDPRQQQTAAYHQIPRQQQTITDHLSTRQRKNVDYQDKHEVLEETLPRSIETASESLQSADRSPHISPSLEEINQPVQKTIFRTPMERQQPNYDVSVRPEHSEKSDPNNNIPNQSSPTLFEDDVDGIISTLSNAEREIYDSARNRAGWESLTEPQERLGPSPTDAIPSEAFVTLCRNNAEAIGCLVVGTSLLLCRTTRTLCVVVSDGVSTAFRGALSTVFQVVQYVRSMESLGTTKLALLEQPELGITFDKLNIWRLSQFTKCVYLNPDTVVIQNCDELFLREELSAVPDIGWPDCFNSGVFVFSPSIDTFWQLLDFAEKQGSYDGGDQGLLNSFFNSWSSDISKKLSFIYNLMANVSYTYTPAFRQFGRNVKIVQFHGSFKPWHVKYFTGTGQISPSSPVHPTYVQFVHIWLNIFRISVLRLMSQEIQSYAASQETICAIETLRFFPLPSESEAEFFLTPPSVRLRLTEKKLNRSTSLPISEARRRKSAEFFRYTDPEDENIPEASTEQGDAQDVKTADASKSENLVREKVEGNVSESDEVFKEKEITAKEEVKDEDVLPEEVKDKNILPGAEIGDYKGMKAWEQGRMDYEGSDSSDNVIKRLQFLMSRPK